MRIIWLALALLFSSPLVAQTPGATLSADTEARWVSFELTPGNQIQFEMMVNGRPASAVLDTGVSYTVVSTGFAKDAGLKPATASNASAIGGRVAVGWASARSLSFGGLTRSNGRIAVADLKAIATGGPRGVDVLVGADVLQCCALEIDYDLKRFRLLPSGRLPFRGTTVPLWLSPTAGIYLGEVTIGARRLRPLIVDTGDGSAITLSRESWTSARARSGTVTSALAYGLGGALETDLTILPSLKMGPLTARNVEVRIEADADFSQQTATAGRIGSAFLQRYHVVLDPRARRMVLAPGKDVDKPPVRSTSGLLIGIERGALRVLHVMRSSPAQAAGWKVDERICRVDDQPIPPDYVRRPIATWMAGAPGRVVKLGLCDGGDRTLTLRAVY